MVPSPTFKVVRLLQKGSGRHVFLNHFDPGTWSQRADNGKQIKTEALDQRPAAANYLHPEADSPMRPEVGTQAQFRKKKPPQTYNYDSSLAPSMEWDGQNPARDLGEWLIRCAEEAAQLPAPHQFSL
jgi:hypothetical protein